MSLQKSIEEMFKQKKERRWDKLFISIDLHNTIIKSGRNIPLYVFPEAERALKYLNTIDYITLILYTSTKVEQLEEFYIWCMHNDIKFSYLNENPECASSSKNGDYTKKYYSNLILDDKAGFDHITDWDILINTIERLRHG